jgi:predicted component of type VI protein secretion system
MDDALAVAVLQGVDQLQQILQMRQASGKLWR